MDNKTKIFANSAIRIIESNINSNINSNACIKKDLELIEKYFQYINDENIKDNIRDIIESIYNKTNYSNVILQISLKEIDNYIKPIFGVSETENVKGSNTLSDYDKVFIDKISKIKGIKTIYINKLDNEESLKYYIIVDNNLDIISEKINKIYIEMMSSNIDWDKKRVINKLKNDNIIYISDFITCNVSWMDLCRIIYHHDWQHSYLYNDLINSLYLIGMNEFFYDFKIDKSDFINLCDIQIKEAKDRNIINSDNLHDIINTKKMIKFTKVY